jgi:hypothetical protein
MSREVIRYSWSEFGVITEAGGIYAWYCSPEITQYDLNKTILAVQHFKDAGDFTAAENLVREVLDTRILRQFREQPYDVVMKGPLKPTYSGKVEHDNTLSGSLVDRLVENPERLRAIRDIIESSAPNFASPLYIGMAQNLRDRLGIHKRLIEKHRQRNFVDRTVDNQISVAEAGFARQVAQRKLPPERLFVVVCAMDTIDGAHVDVENLLNRIYYPVLGRN